MIRGCGWPNTDPCLAAEFLRRGNCAVPRAVTRGVEPVAAQVTYTCACVGQRGTLVMTSHRQHGAGCQPSTPAPPLHTKTTSSPISARGAQERPLSPKPKVEPALRVRPDLPALRQQSGLSPCVPDQRASVGEERRWRRSCEVSKAQGRRFPLSAFVRNLRLQTKGACGCTTG